MRQGVSSKRPPRSALANAAAPSSPRCVGNGSFPESSSSPPGEIGRYCHYAPSVEIINTVWHSDQEAPETISLTGREAVTRAYAKFVADTGSVNMRDLRVEEKSL